MKTRVRRREEKDVDEKENRYGRTEEKGSELQMTRRRLNELLMKSIKRRSWERRGVLRNRVRKTR